MAESKTPSKVTLAAIAEHRLRCRLVVRNRSNPGIAAAIGSLLLLLSLYAWHGPASFSRTDRHPYSPELAVDLPYLSHPSPVTPSCFLYPEAPGESSLATVMLLTLLFFLLSLFFVFRCS